MLATGLLLKANKKSILIKSGTVSDSVRLKLQALILESRMNECRAFVTNTENYLQVDILMLKKLSQRGTFHKSQLKDHNHTL